MKLSRRDISESEIFGVPRISPCGIFVISCPPAEPFYENSEHFTISEDISSLDSVLGRIDISSPHSLSVSLCGRRLLEDPDLQ
jgi:hypothetical protein